MSDKEPINLVMTYRAGDLMIMLPCAHHWAKNEGREVRWVVHSNFAEVLEGVSYVTPIVWAGDLRDQADALRSLPIRGYHGGRTIVPRVATGQAHFTSDFWINAGLLDKFHDLPLVFDNRDAGREALLYQRLVGDAGGKPILAYNFQGHSTPLPNPAEMESWLIERNKVHGEPFKLVNLSAVRAVKLYDQLGILEKADCILTIDTVTVHLAHATDTPTIDIIANETYHQPDARHHWIDCMTVNESITSAGRRRIEDWLFNKTSEQRKAARGRLIGRGHTPLAGPQAMSRRILHICNLYDPKDAMTSRRFMIAQDTWKEIGKRDKNYRFIEHRVKPGDRTGKDIGDARDVPYLKDVIDLAVKQAKPDDIVVLSNADNALTPDAMDVIRREMSAGVPCCYSARVDYDAVHGPKTRDELARQRIHVGNDIFAFTPQWWKGIRDEFPDMLIAYEGWDFVMYQMMLRDNPMAKIMPPICFHQRHDQYWIANRATAAGQHHNHKAGREWAAKFGYMEWVGDGPVLFMNAPRRK